MSEHASPVAEGSNDSRKKPRYVLLKLLALALGTTALNSVATQYVASRLGYDPALGPRYVAGLYQPFAWIEWQGAPWADQVRSAFLIPKAGFAGIAIATMLITMLINQQRTAKPKPLDDVHGSARWASLEDIREMGLIGNAHGIYIGAFEDRKTRTVHYLRDSSGAHLAGIAPTRSGKGLGLVLPNLLSWAESAVIYDPKGELWQLTAGWRKSIGHNVVRYEPAHPTDSAGFNVLEEIRLGTEFEVADAQNIAVMIIDPDGRGFKDHWDRTGFGLLTGVILHALYASRGVGAIASLASVARLLSSPAVDPMELYMAMATNKHLGGKPHPAIAAAGVDQIKREERERGSVLSTVKTYMSLFLDPIIARNCEESSFHIKDLMDHDRPTSLYIVVPGADSVRLRPLVRIFFTMAMSRLTSAPILFDREQRQIPAHRHKLLMMMDEFPTLRKMALFESLLAVCSGFGITAFLIMQDREQLLGAYGDHQSVLANVHSISAYAPNESKTADWLSHMLGTQTINREQFSESGKRGGWLQHVSRSYAHFSRPLMTPDEVKRLPGPVKDGSRVVAPGQMLVLPTGRKPILGRQILYFEDPIFAERARIPAPEFGDDLVSPARFQLT
jgi:type IV secretion system protein VirD4